MKRMHFVTGEINPSGQLVLTLVEPGFDDKQSAAKGAKSLEPGTYMLVSFDSPDPLVVAPRPPPHATWSSSASPSWRDRSPTSRPRSRSRVAPRSRSSQWLCQNRPNVLAVPSSIRVQGMCPVKVQLMPRSASSASAQGGTRLLPVDPSLDLPADAST